MPQAESIIPARFKGLLPFVCLAATGAVLVSRLVLISQRPFDPDELEHAHVAWSISQGAVPFRDFFEHHMPLFHYLIAPVMGLMAPHLSLARGLDTLLAVRALMWALSVLIVVTTFRLASDLYGRRVAWLSCPLLATSIVLSQKGIEIRPDGLATLLWLLSLIWLFRGVTGTPSSARDQRATFAWSGLLLGLAVLTNQKLLLAGPALAMATVWYWLDDGWGASRSERLANVAMQVLGFLIPCAIFAAVFAMTGGLPALVRNAFLGGLAWKAEARATLALRFLARYDPWLLALATAGAVMLALEALRRDSQWRTIVMFVVITAGVFVGLFLIPVPFIQYCLTFIPLLAVLAAVFLVRVTSASFPAPAIGFGVLTMAAVAWIDLDVARPVVFHPALYPCVVVGAVVALALSVRARRQDLGLAAVVLALCLYPAQWSLWTFSVTDPVQAAGLRYVMSTTPPGAVVLDGWSGYGVFRPHAWYYWMLHPGVRAMLPESVAGTLADGFRTGVIHPDVVVLDSSLQEFSPELAALVPARDRFSGVKDIWIKPSGQLKR